MNIAGNACADYRRSFPADTELDIRSRMLYIKKKKHCNDFLLFIGFTTIIEIRLL